MDLHSFAKNTTTSPGVYIMYDKSGTIIYIGKAKNLRNRLKNYLIVANEDGKTEQLLFNLARIEVTITPSEVDALLLEISLIRKHKPRYNIQFKDSKGYPYIVIDTTHQYPRLFTTRNRKYLNKLKCFGPYPNSKAMYSTLNYLYKVFKLRDCKDSYFSNRSRPCLRYQINRCHAPCTGLINKEEYSTYVNLVVKLLNGNDEAVLDELRYKMNAFSNNKEYMKAAEYRDLIQFVQILVNKQIVTKGKGDCDFIAIASNYGQSCLHILQTRNGEITDSKTIIPRQNYGESDIEILVAFLSTYYLDIDQSIMSSKIYTNIQIPNAYLDLLSQALSKSSKKKLDFYCPTKGNKKELLDISIASAAAGLSHRINVSDFYKYGLEQLQKLLGISKSLGLLECFDISHFGGEATLASCVVANFEGLKKDLYRCYKLPEVSSGDDYKALMLVIKKRYTKILQSGKDLPDIVIIDGGIGQMSSVLEVFKELGLSKLPVLAIAKGKERKAGLEKIYYMDSKSPVGVDKNSNLFRMLQIIRDESHKHAISNNRRIVRKKRTTSVLERIEGVGLLKRKRILEHFGGIQGVLNASVKDLANVKGIGLKLATIIFNSVHSK